MASVVKGKVSVLYPTQNGCYVKLLDLAANRQPKSKYFLLQLPHKNYNAIYSLLLSAAINRLVISIKTPVNPADLNKTYSPEIDYVQVEWK
jgi:hypothetical protein